MEYFTGITGLMVGLVVGAVVGYCACLWWGKPARIMRKAAEKGIDVVGEITRRSVR
jgi:hypothetical protein